MLLWDVRLVDNEAGRHTALVLAADPESAAEAATQELSSAGSSVKVRDVREREWAAEVLSIEMRDDEVGTPNEWSLSGPAIYKVRWNDGLFRRSPGASLVFAPDAITALRLVLAVDPFEGQPPYGVPPAFGPVERFEPPEPYVFWINLDWPNRE